MPVVEGVGEEVVADAVALEEAVLLEAVGEDGVVEALVGVARDGRVLGAEVEVIPERAGPVLVVVRGAIDARGDQFCQLASRAARVLARMIG